MSGQLPASIPDPVPVEVRARSDASLSVALDRGLCVGADNDDWFPTPLDTSGFANEARRAAESELARRLCLGCPVRLECLELALRIPHGMYGVWGGTAPWERRGIRAARAREAA